MAAGCRRQDAAGAAGGVVRPLPIASCGYMRQALELRMSEDNGAGDLADAEMDERRAAYLRERAAREKLLLPKRVDMETFFGEDKCPEYIARWGGMHRQSAMEGPTRKALEMAMDSEWAVDSWNDTPTSTETEGTPTPSS